MPASFSIAWTVPMLVIASVVVVSILGFVSRSLRRALILSPYRIRESFEVHRLLTGGWVHADATHLLFNMLTLYFFADRVVHALGPALFLVLYVSAVIVAHLPTTVRHMRDPKYGSLGASGAVAAVMFSAVLLYPKLELSLMLLPVRVPGLIYAALYLAYSAWSSWRAKDGINHDAHFAGAIYGALFTYVIEPQRVAQTLKTIF